MDINDTKLDTWFERDRAYVSLDRKDDDSVIVEWRDEDVAQAIEDGFLNPRSYHCSAYEYARSRGLLQ